MTLSNIIIYLFITRAGVIFIFTLFYLFLQKINRFDEKKFKGVLVMSLIPFELTVPLTILALVSDIVNKISTSMLKLIWKILIKK